MAPACCECRDRQPAGGARSRANLPLICLVPRDDPRAAKQYGSGGKPRPASASAGGTQSDFQLLDEDYIKAHFKLPKRALYLDPFRVGPIVKVVQFDGLKHLLKFVSPLVKPGFEAMGMSAPFIVQMNPEGKWENTKPANLDEDRLKAIVQHLVGSNAISAAQSYCCQCAAENQLPKSTPQYVPVVMMPIYSADQCPFDMECEVQKIKDAEKSKGKPSKKKQAVTKEEEKDDDKKKIKKRGYQMQRLTDFDLLSQW